VKKIVQLIATGYLHKPVIRIEITIHL